jgi:diguanylate cyclase (GGDEF)-like protein/PAS domain S-box-containing protein
MPGRVRRSLLTYGIAVIATGVAVALALVLWPVTERATVPLLLVAVMLSARYGLGPGLAATGLAAVAIHVLLVPSRWWQLPTTRDLLATAVFVVTALMIGSIAARHRRAEVTSRESEARKDAMLQASLDCVIAMDHEGRIIEFNPAAERTFGYHRSQVLGRDLAGLLIPPSLREQHTQGVAHYLATGERRIIGRRVELIGMRADGTEFPIELTISRTPVDGPPQFTAFVRDLTDRRKAEDERVQLLAERRAAERLAEQVNEVVAQRTREVELLNRTSELLQACLTVEEAFSVAGRAAALFFPSDTGAIFLTDASHTLVEARAEWGQRPPGWVTAFRPDQCWALRRGRPHVVADTRSGLLCQHLPRQLPASYVCVPLAALGETLGILYKGSTAEVVGTTDPGESRHLLVVTVADHVALALANLRLRETLRNQSIRDPLTGLFNRRYMEETLDRELRRAERGKHSLGVVMADIDNFKQLNDSFGHAAGDVYLRGIGALLRSSVRGADVACRYGGEELVIILPEASLGVTRRRAEQLREAVGRLRAIGRGGTVLAATISLGVAAYPDHGTSPEMLLNAADEALYRAKNAGRDRVEVAD